MSSSSNTLYRGTLRSLIYPDDHEAINTEPIATIARKKQQDENNRKMNEYFKDIDLEFMEPINNEGWL